MKNLLKRKNIIILFLSVIIFCIPLVICLSLNTYKTYLISYIPFGTLFLSLMIIYPILEDKIKDKKAKSFKWSFLTNLSINNSNKDNRLKFYLKLLSIILFIIFFARFYFYKEKIDYYVDGVNHNYEYYDFLHLNALLISDKLYSLVSLSHFERTVGSIFNDLWISLIILELISSIYLSKNNLNIRKYIGLPISILVTIFSPFVLRGIVGFNFSYKLVLMGFEMALIDFYYFTSLFEKNNKKFSQKEALSLICLAVPFLISSMSSYTPCNIFGFTIFSLGNPHQLTDLSHRLMIYIAIFLPIFYYLILRGCNKALRRAALIQISLGSLLGYMSLYRYDIWLNISSWPLHLCNTAMYTMPLTLLFTNYILFYFTFFINVLGAFLALMMPNYQEILPFLSPRIIVFYINHWHAFFMPLLIVLLKIYERPKMKYFIYSQIGFLIYFIFVMFVNTYLTAHGTSCDFFFINSSFVADKLGDWAKKLFNVKTILNIGSNTYTFHLLYDFIYYLVYIVLAFGMWFIYEVIFRKIDEYEVLVYSKEKIKNRRNLYIQRNRGELNLEKLNTNLIVSHLAKKYLGQDKYTIEDLSLNLEGGKIYGFLGKNGAGKSTLIKSIVGIHSFDKGDISICGYDINEYPLEAKSLVGYVPDNYALYENLTGRQYVNYIADLYKVDKEKRKKLEEELVSSIDMNSFYDKPMKTYSHGMKQKITIISALIHEPKVWILDEPMTGLDPKSIYQIKEFMKTHAKKGNIVFFSSHLIDIVKNLCDEVIIIKKGNIVKQIDLNKFKIEKENLEQIFLSLTSDTKEEKEILLLDKELL